MSTDVIEQAVKVMAEHGFTSGGGNPHCWRCEHPDRYGHCSCPEELAQGLVDAGLLPKDDLRVHVTNQLNKPTYVRIERGGALIVDGYVTPWEVVTDDR